MTTKLPAYFKEYLDERFDTLSREVKEVKEDVKQVKYSVDELKKKVGNLAPKVSDNAKRIKTVALVVGALGLATLYHIGANEGFSVVKVLFSLL